MNEDARYLQNESRAAHRRYRGTQQMLRWTVVLWLLLVAGMTGAAVVDVTAKIGWGYEAKDIWGGLLMLVLGCVFWGFATFVNRVVLGISRRLYGPEPAVPTDG